MEKTITQRVKFVALDVHKDSIDGGSRRATVRRCAILAGSAAIWRQWIAC